MKRKMLIVVSLLLFFGTVIYAETIPNNNVSLRSGAGAFFPVIKVLKKGDDVDILNKGKFWYKVSTGDNKSGWVSANSFRKVKKSINYGLISSDLSGRSISNLMVTAAVKGFFENRIKHKNINGDLFKAPFRKYIDPYQFMNFKVDTFRGRDDQYSFRNRHNLEYTDSFTVTEDMFATSAFVIGRLGAPGLIDDMRLTQYVNDVAQLVVESTEFFDMPITVHIVNTDEIFANATPIGVVMISKGMLKAIRSENELACLIAHEIAHITLGHGIKETGKRKHMIKAQSAFDELDEEMPDEEKDADMDELADSMYEVAVKGRKSEYEMEADKRGAIYAFRAGYDPNGMANLLSRLKTMIKTSDDPENSSHWMPRDMQKRIDKIKEFTGSLSITSEYLTFSSRYMNSLR